MDDIVVVGAWLHTPSTSRTSFKQEGDGGRSSRKRLRLVHFIWIDEAEGKCVLLIKKFGTISIALFEMRNWFGYRIARMNDAINEILCCNAINPTIFSLNITALSSRISPLLRVLPCRIEGRCIRFDFRDC